VVPVSGLIVRSNCDLPIIIQSDAERECFLNPENLKSVVLGIVKEVLHFLFMEMRVYGVIDDRLSFEPEFEQFIVCCEKSWIENRGQYSKTVQAWVTEFESRTKSHSRRRWPRQDDFCIGERVRREVCQVRIKALEPFRFLNNLFNRPGEVIIGR
jgi:hypothetical protein